MNIITGGTGFLGAHVAYHLISKGEEVKILKRKGSSDYLIRKIFKWYSNNPEDLFKKIKWENADILDIFSLEDSIDDFDKVYHTAATVSFDKKDRDKILHNNINGTRNLVNVLLDKKDVKLCHVSSIGALGRTSNPGKLITEKTHFTSSTNPSIYSISKFESEREVWRGMEEGLQAFIVKPSIILGPGDWEKGSVKLIKTVFKGLKFYTRGVNGFVDVNDVAEIMIKLMESDVSGEQFIISSGNVSYKQLFDWMAEALNVKPPKYKAGKILSEVGWRASAVKGKLTGKQPVITRETATTANRIYKYDNSKLFKYIDYDYTPVKETVTRTAKIFLEDLD